MKYNLEGILKTKSFNDHLIYIKQGFFYRAVYFI
jgi:hypothetical protein